MEGEDYSARVGVIVPRVGAAEVKVEGIAVVDRRASAELNKVC